MKRNTTHYSNIPTMNTGISNAKATHLAERKIKVDKKQKWASKPGEYLELIRNIFKDFITNNLGHTPGEIILIMGLFDNHINQDNIKFHLNKSSAEIYNLITN